MCLTPLCASKHKQHKEDMSPPTKNWRQRRTEHRLYAEIATDTQHETQNAKTHNRTSQT